MTLLHFCRFFQSFTIDKKLTLNSFQNNRVESIRVLEKGSQYSLVRYYLARWIALFLCHLFHERRQCHNIFGCPKDPKTSQFNVNMIQFNQIYRYLILISRPTLVLEVVLSCRLILNLRSAGEISASKLPISSRSDNAKTPHATLSSGVLLEDQLRSTELASMHGPREMRLEPNRARPIDTVDSTRNAQTLYTN